MSRRAPRAKAKASMALDVAENCLTCPTMLSFSVQPTFLHGLLVASLRTAGYLGS
jgi:hypothetical protein